MDLETQVLLDYKKYITNKSRFGEMMKVLPNYPQSFSIFPTIVVQEKDNTMNSQGNTLEGLEYVDYVLYQVDIYTKNVVLGKEEIPARNVINELKYLTFNYFRQMGFIRVSAQRTETLDINMSRYTMVFSAKQASWNRVLI